MAATEISHLIEDAATRNEWTLDALKVEGSDTSPDQILTRTVERIIAKNKAFEIEMAGFDGLRNEGFGWGRSSIGKVVKRFFKIVFMDWSTETKHEVTIMVSSTHYERRNPYDRAPKDHGRESVTFMAGDETKKLLGWK